jgi:SAM-dependent methyltransferase
MAGIVHGLRTWLRRVVPRPAVEFVRPYIWQLRSSYFSCWVKSWFVGQSPKLRCFGPNGGSVLAKQLSAINVLRPTRMCRVMMNYGSDKGGLKPYHNYTTVYSVLFKKYRTRPARIFEMGLGSNDPDIPFTMRNGRPGASLRGWRDLFPRAYVYGADIDHDSLFQEERIKTFYCDQLDPAVIRQLWSQPDLRDPLDIIIDDGLHTLEGNTCLLEASLDRLSPGGVYVVEDIEKRTVPPWYERIETVYSKQYPAYEFLFVTLPNPQNDFDNNLLVIRRAE